MIHFTCTLKIQSTPVLTDLEARDLGDCRPGLSHEWGGGLPAIPVLWIHWGMYAVPRYESCVSFIA